jgi:hypothetical protein
VRMTQLVTRSVAAMIVILLMAAGAAAATAAHATARAPSGISFSTDGALFGVTAISASNAWAVGGTSFGTLILHWNGRAWS